MGGPCPSNGNAAFNAYTAVIPQQLRGKRKAATIETAVEAEPPNVEADEAPKAAL